MPYLKDDDNIVRISSIELCKRDSNTSITMMLSTPQGTGLNGVTLKFPNKVKADAFWSQLEALT